jgi:threonine aldolase
MFEAEVGDDVFEDDPTVKALEFRVARMFNKEAALYFPTGTMANLAAVMSWCNSRGSEMILGEKSHIFLYEQGGMSQLAGVCPRTLPNNPDGTIDIDLIEQAIRSDNVHFTSTQVLILTIYDSFCPPN